MFNLREDPFCTECGDRLPQFGARNGFCQTCSKRFNKGPQKTMGSRFDSAKETIRQKSRPSWVYDTVDNYPKDPLLAPVLSAVIPGGGQVYNAHFLKAVIIFITSPLVIPWLIGIVDAFFSARHINSRWARANAQPA